MPTPPMVSIITIFLNEARFIREAIDSVHAQTYGDWELLLVDDGSTDRSTEIARDAASAEPHRIRYLEHEGRANLGMSAARNLGLRHARGRYLAFLDADDIWLPMKLQKQVPQLEHAPEVDMTYCMTEYWHSWTADRDARAQDHFYRPVEADSSFHPPELLTHFLANKVLMPCMGSILVRREVVNAIGGWELAFRGLFEDQVFFSKLCLTATMRVTTECYDRYRQHPASCCAVGSQSGQLPAARRRFLEWLSAYLVSKQLRGTESWHVLQQELAKP